MFQKKPSSPWVVVLAFDFGVKRIGVAVGQSVTHTATPLPIIPAKAGIPNAAILEEIVTTWKPDAFIVGIPLNMDGTLSSMALRARKFARRLQAQFQKPWYAVDERLSTFEAKMMIQKPTTDNLFKQPIDSLVAQHLLESWMQVLSE